MTGCPQADTGRPAQARQAQATITKPSPIRPVHRYGCALSFGFPSGKDSSTVKTRLLALASAALVAAAVAAPAAQAARPRW